MKYEVIDRLQSTLGLSPEKMADWVELTAYEFDRVRESGEELSAHSTLMLSERIGVAMEHLVTGQIDFGSVAARMKGQQNVLPEKYTKAAFSRKRTSINVLQYLEDFMGWKSKHRALKHLQVDETCFADADEQISLKFLSDLSDWLVDNGFSIQQLRRMGSYSVATNFNSVLGQEYRKCRKPSEVIEACFKQFAHLYDQNLIYQIDSLDSASARIVGNPNPELLEMTHGDFPAGANLCETRAGTFSAFPAYLGLPFAHVHNKKCIHHGDSRCEYEIDFSEANRIGRPRPLVF